jgi:hypothetical protein
MENDHDRPNPAAFNPSVLHISDCVGVGLSGWLPDLRRLLLPLKRVIARSEAAKQSSA